jgi:hypothetical protein
MTVMKVPVVTGVTSFDLAQEDGRGRPAGRERRQEPV